MYRIRSREGKEMITHHDNHKPCVLPAKVGIPHCPTSERTDITVVLGEPILQEEVNGQHQGQFTRPAQLRQTSDPLCDMASFHPLNYGRGKVL